MFQRFKTVTLLICWKGCQMINLSNGSDWFDPNSGGTSWIDPQSMDYHMKQWREPKESTKAFLEYFSNELSLSKSILDLGAGAGAATSYLAKRNLRTEFKGVDHSNELINIAKILKPEYDILTKGKTKEEVQKRVPYKINL